MMSLSKRHPEKTGADETSEAAFDEDMSKQIFYTEIDVFETKAEGDD